MKKYMLIILILSGCNSTNDKNEKFDVNQFGAVANIAMHNFNNTRPVDYAVTQPFKELETLCASYEFTPQKKRSSMMNLLFEAGYADFIKVSPSPEMDRVLIISARRNADLAFQVCDNAYRTSHGQVFKPVKLNPSEYYTGTEWNQ